MTDPLLIFIDAADDAAANPLSRLYGMTVAADATLKMWFSSSIAGGHGAGGTEADLVTLTVTADTELKVFKSIDTTFSGINSLLSFLINF